MRRNGFLFCVAFAFFVPVFVMSLSYEAHSGPEQKEPVKLGAVLDMTGFVGQLGPRFKESLNMRLEEAGWKVAGRPIRLIIEDGASDSATSLDKIKKLVERDHVKVIFGPLLSDIGMAVAPYLSKHGVMSICLLNDPIEMKKYGNRIVYPGTLYTESMPLGRYAFEELGFKTMSVLGVDYVAGWRYLGGPMETFKKAGGQVIQKQWFPPGTTDFGPYLSSVKKADCFLFWNTGMAVGIKQYYDFGLKMPMLLNVPASQTEMIFGEVGDLALGTIGAGSYSPWIDNPLNKKFVAKFKSKFGRYPDFEDSTCYVTASMVLAALEKTGGDATYEKLRPAFNTLKMDTIQGPVYVDPDGITINNRYIMEAKKVDGEYTWTVIKTIPEQKPVTPPADKQLRE